MAGFLSQLCAVSESIARDREKAEALRPSDKTPEELAAEKAQRFLDGARRGGEIRSRKVQERYRKVFQYPITTADAAKIMQVKHVALHNQLRRYEAKGLVRQTGSRVHGNGGAAILWQWCGW